MVRRQLHTQSERSCILGDRMYENFKNCPVVNLSAYLVFITLLFAVANLGNNIQGNRLQMVFLITSLIIVQNCATIIFESVFICETTDKYFSEIWKDFLYTTIEDLTNLQSYVTLIWTYNWMKAALNLKLSF